MHTDQVSAWTHDRVFRSGNAAGERGARWVLAIAALAGGWWQTRAGALTLVSHDTALDAAAVRRALSVHGERVHTTIEVHRCPDAP